MAPRTSTPIWSSHQHKSLLRFITCGSVDDGKSTLIGRLLYDSKMIFEDQLGGAGVRQQADGHPRPEHRLRPAGRRPGGGTRAGHHHRCRLSLLLHRQAQVHRRRHPRPRAVHPQYGHRRLHRRSGGDPDRRAQGRADPDPASQLSGASDRDPPAWCWRSTRWTWSITSQRRPTTTSSPTMAPSPRSIGIERVHSPMPISGFKGDNITSALGQHPLVSPGRP